MRFRSIGSMVLGLFAAVALLAACLPESRSPASDRARGHEGEISSVVPGPPAAVVAVPRTPAVPLPGCRSIEQRLASIVKAAPDAALARPADRAGYIAAFNRAYGLHVAADDVAIVTSKLWGNLALVLFERHGCEAGTEQIEVNAFGGWR